MTKHCYPPTMATFWRLLPETDYWMMLHPAHAMDSDCKDICIVASDTDVVVLAIALASLYSECCIWIAFSYAKHFAAYLPTKLQQNLKRMNYGVCFSCTHLQIMTLYLHSMESKINHPFQFKLHHQTYIFFVRTYQQPLCRLRRRHIEAWTADSDAIQQNSPTERVNEARKFLCTPTRNALIQHINYVQFIKVDTCGVKCW
jgi:hypothetical protein